MSGPVLTNLSVSPSTARGAESCLNTADPPTTVVSVDATDPSGISVVFAVPGITGGQKVRMTFQCMAASPSV